MEALKFSTKKVSFLRHLIITAMVTMELKVLRYATKMKITTQQMKQQISLRTVSCIFLSTNFSMTNFSFTSNADLGAVLCGDVSRLSMHP